MSLKPLIEKFSRNYSCVVTVFTKSGKKRADEFFKTNTEVFYFPFDKKRELEKIIKNSKAVILAESELWPNLLEISFRYKKKIFLVNGRISKKSTYFYKNFFKDIKKYLQGFKLLFLQDKKYREYFLKLGIPEEKIIVLRNLKYDSIERDVEPLFEKKDFIITFGSVRRDEVNIFINVIEKILTIKNNLKIIIAPRHLINTGYIESKLKEKGIKYEKRSETPSPSGKVFILDTLGELIRVWKISDIGVVGGTFGNHGGHNLAEPASFRIPVIFGESTENVEEVARELVKRKGGIRVRTEEELLKAIENLIKDDNLRKKFGENAGKTIDLLRGSSDIIYREISKFLRA